MAVFERFTQAARTVVTGAEAQARALGHGRIGAAHLVLAVVAGPDGSGAEVLRALGADAERLRALVAEETDGLDATALAAIGIDLDAVRGAAEESFGPDALGPRSRGQGRRREGTGLRFDDGAKRALEGALREAVALRDRHIGAEHVLLGALGAPDRTLARVLARAGVDPEEVRRGVRERRDAA